MEPVQRYQIVNLVLFALAIVHALVTWPLPTVAVLFAGGALLAFVAELAVVNAGLLEHEMAPQVGGVPLSVLGAWPAVVYLAYRVALYVVPAGVRAAAVAAVLATALDVATDPNGVSEGVWRYPKHRVSEARFRGVPLWNFVGWLVIVFVTAMLPTILL